MNTNKRKKLYRLGLLNNASVTVNISTEEAKPAIVAKEETKISTEESVQLPIALKELPEEKTDVVVSQEEIQAPVEKKKSVKVKKVVEEDKLTDV